MNDLDLHMLSAVGDLDRWPAVLEQVAAAHGAIGAALVPGRDPSMMRYTPSMQAGFDNYVADGIYLDDKRMALMPKLATRKVVHDLDAYSPQQMARMAYYQDWLPAQHMGTFAAARGGTSEDAVVLALYREKGEPEFEEQALQALEPVSDALMRAIALDRAVGSQALAHRTRWHEAQGSGIIGLERGGRVAFAGEGAARFLGTSLSIRHGRLVFASADDEAAFMAALSQSNGIAHAAALGHPHERTLPDRVWMRADAHWSGNARDAVAGTSDPRTTDPRPTAGANFAFRASGAMALDVHPITEGYRGLVAASHLLVLSDPFATQVACREAYVALWDLTAREAELVALLVDGLLLGEAAWRMGIREASARTYLKAIYRKTGTRAQSELVARAARLTR